MIGQCSEMMLIPPSMLTKSASYAFELEKWARTFPRSSLKIIHTDSLSRYSQQVLNETFTFLGLPPVDVGKQSRFCVRGKAGVMDVLRESDLNISFGTNGSSAATLKVGDCETLNEPTTHVDPINGAVHHYIEPQLQERLKRSPPLLP